MSQVLENDEAYKLKLQNLLAKGRALGIKFIFSSQSFMTGIRGLTSVAKEQIQTRIAMHNNMDEITETLELPRFLKTEQNNFMIATLPTHMALRKYHKSENELILERVKVLYFKGEAEDAYKPQRDLICDINKKLHKIDKSDFDGNSPLTYVDKRPVVVDGNTYKAFVLESQKEMIEEYKNAHYDDVAEEDVLISFGSPRRMENIIFTNISNESRENIMIVARGTEMQCAASLISTVCESFRLQDGVVKIWAYSKNRIFKTYKDTAFSKYEIYEGIEDICSAIKDLKNAILERKNSNEVIILLGMEQICSDFEFIDFGVSNNVNQSKLMKKYSKYESNTDEEIAKTNETINFNLAFAEKYNVDEIEDRLMDEGKSTDEINSEIAKLTAEFAKEFYANKEIATEKFEDIKEDSIAEINSVVTNDDPDDEKTSNAYNALEDFKYVIKQGSRFGYHFVFCVNNMSDFKSARVGLDAFRHRLAFQISADDSSELFGNRVASKLPEHICQYSNQLDQYSLRPYIHKEISWDGWIIDEDGKTTNI
jgi:tRNA splicing endonuclease